MYTSITTGTGDTRESYTIEMDLSGKNPACWKKMLLRNTE